MKRSAFTMVELVFVIVVLGILAALAIPRLAASRDDAQIVKGKADVAAIRSSIAMTRSRNLLSGNASFPDLNGSSSTTELFGGVLDYPIQASASGWNMISSNGLNYTFRADNTNVRFDYNRTTGIFTCDVAANSGYAQQLCTKLTQ
jgi:general secretion pathway protein G